MQPVSVQQQPSGQAGRHDHSQLHQAALQLPGRQRSQHHDGQPHRSAAQCLRHPPHRLRHDGHGHDLQAVHHVPGEPMRILQHRQRYHHQQQRGGQRKTQPGRQGTTIAAPDQADGQSDLAAGGAGQELAHGHQVGIGLFGQPAPPCHEFMAEVAEMGGWPAKGGQSQSEEDHEQGPGRLAGRAWQGRVSGGYGSRGGRHAVVGAGCPGSPGGAYIRGGLRAK